MDLNKSKLKVLIVEYLKGIGYTYDSVVLSVNLKELISSDGISIILNSLDKTYACMSRYKINIESSNNYSVIPISSIIEYHRRIRIKKLLNE
jgi:hypothetical protein